MRATTKQRYQRIQAAYRRLSRKGLSYELCVQFLCEFFGSKDPKHINKIIKESIQEVPFDHQELDDAWFDARAQKHWQEVQDEQTSI